LGISSDANLAFKQHLFKLSFSIADEASFLSFISPSLFFYSATISYGYIISHGDFIINPNFAIGAAHYISRGRLIPDSSQSFFSFSENYETIEGTGIIIKIPFYFHYRVSDRFWAGIFIEPFFVGPISGFSGGIVFSVGKMWTEH